MKITRLLLALAGTGALAEAQTLTGIAAVDSAAVARDAYRRAAAATDPAVALEHIQRSATAWPTQPAYAWARAVLAARAGDAATSLRALDDYASLTLGRDLRSVTEFALHANSPQFNELVAMHDANRAPMAASRIVLAHDDSALWPEAADFDAGDSAWYVGSVRRGTVIRVGRDGRSRALWRADSLRAGAVFGVRVDGRRRALWVTTSGVPQQEGFAPRDTVMASLIRVGLDDGRIRRWDLSPAPGGHVLGDLGIGPRGDVFLTDARHSVLYRKRPTADSLEAIRHPLFNSLQGVAPSPDGAAVYIADYSHGLLRLDLVSGAVIRLPDAPRSTSLGCDGIAWYQGGLVAVQNGVSPARIMRFVLDSSGRAIRRAEVIDRNIAIADEPTIGTIVGDEFIYVANSHWEKYDASGRLRPHATLRGTVLLGVPLK
jgi:sugar lactone lactonase YvrE